MNDDPIHIVGAGPVGSLLACLLGRQGRMVTIWEKRTELPDCSMAIGISPVSLDILDTVGLGDLFREQGVLIHSARVWEAGEECGTLTFRAPEDTILSLPQANTLSILRDAFQQIPTVRFRFGEAYPESSPHDPHTWVIACDGAKSGLREQAGLRSSRHGYGLRFVMADAPDEEQLGPEARLYFSPDGAVESFPLPGQHRRWIAQVQQHQSPTLEHLRERVRDAARVDLGNRECGSPWPFDPRWGLARTYVKDRLVLCGDAAHQMSPIGGQGMNTGFADACLLAHVLQAPSPQALRMYTRSRQRAFRIAARRAAWGMWLGSRTGPTWSRVRKALVTAALAHHASHDTLARTFSMRNLPRLSPC